MWRALRQGIIGEKRQAFVRLNVEVGKYLAVVFAQQARFEQICEQGFSKQRFSRLFGDGFCNVEQPKNGFVFKPIQDDVTKLEKIAVFQCWGWRDRQPLPRGCLLFI